MKTRTKAFDREIVGLIYLICSACVGLRGAENGQTSSPAGIVPQVQASSSLTARIIIPDNQVTTSFASVESSPDGRFLKTEQSGMVAIWDSAGNRPKEFDAVDADRVRFAANSKYVLVARGCDAELWDLDIPKKIQTLSGAKIGLGGILNGIYSLAFSPDGQSAVTGNDSTIVVWNLASGEPIKTFSGVDKVTEVQFFPDGQKLLVRRAMGKLQILRVTDGQITEEFTQAIGYGIVSLLSRDGRWLIIQKTFDQIDLLDLSTERVVRSFPISAVLLETTVAFSPNSSYLLIAGSILKLETLELTTLTKATAAVPGCFSADGNLVAFIDASANSAVIWSLKEQREALRVAVQTEKVISVAFWLQDRFLVTTSADGISRTIDLTGPNRTCSFTTFKSGAWIVMDPTGRFDVSDVNGMRDLRIHLGDGSSDSIPLEAAVHDYFEPNLLERFVNNEPFPIVKDLKTLDLARPVVEIQDIKPKTAKIDTVEVTVKVTYPREIGRAEQGSPPGIYDLRLSCDGRLVGYAPAQPGEIPLQNGEATLKFDVPLSHHRQNVEFSAYAFNHDRVKSVTATKAYTSNLKNTTRDRAYIVSIGISKFESSLLYSLPYAPEDAAFVFSTIGTRLSALSTVYAKVINIPLIQTQTDNSNYIQPTKTNIKTVLDILAGKPLDRPTIRSFPNELAKQLRKASPDDLVLIFVATHGYKRQDGEFYLFPCDTGSSDEIGELLPKAISSTELSDWLRDIVAGDAVLLLDVCNSGAVAGRNFQAAPLGDRGLGQLSYEKGMRILAATQDDNDAAASGERKHGLLTWALIQKGINEKAAADEFTHQAVSIKNWLEYARGEVPELFLSEIPQGKKKVQRPLLLDFSQSKDNRLIAFFFQ